MHIACFSRGNGCLRTVEPAVCAPWTGLGMNRLFRYNGVGACRRVPDGRVPCREFSGLWCCVPDRLRRMRVCDCFFWKEGLAHTHSGHSPVRMGDGLCCVFRVHNPERLEAHRYAFVDEMQERTPPIGDECASDVVRLRVAGMTRNPFSAPMLLRTCITNRTNTLRHAG